MKFRNLFFAALALVGFATSCEEIGKVLDEQLSLTSEPTVTLAADGKDSKTVTFKSTVDWSLRNYDEATSAWLDINPTSGKGSNDEQSITITARPNSGTERSVDITIYGNVMCEASIHISQLGLIESGDGSLEKPYSASEANAVVAKMGANVNSENPVYIKGIVSLVEEISTQYGNGTYYISDDGTTNDQFLVFRGYSVAGNPFTSENEIKSGDQLIICAHVVNYDGKTPETVSGKSWIYSLNGEIHEKEEVPVGGQTIDNGDYAMIVSYNSQYYAAMTVTSANRMSVTTTTADGAGLDANHCFTFEYDAASDFYTIKDINGKYLSWTESTKFALSETVDDGALWDIQVKEDGTHSIRNVKADDRYIMLNANNETLAVGTYKTNQSGYYNPTLVAFTGSTEPVVPESVTIGEILEAASEKYAANPTTSNTNIGSFKVDEALVVALPTTSTAIVGDESGMIYLYKSSHGLAVGDKISLDGTVTLYYGTVIEYNSPDIEKISSGAEVTHPEALEWDGAALDAYFDAAPYKVKYVSLSGVVETDGTYISIAVAGAEKAYISAYGEDLSAHIGKTVKVAGYVYNVNTSRGSVSMDILSAEVDETEPYLTVSTDELKWASDETEAKTVTVSTNQNSWTASTEAEWLELSQEGEVLTITPKDANTSTEEARSATIVIVAGELQKEITATQAKKVVASEGAVTYTLTFPDDNQANNPVSAYNATWTAKIGDNSWSIYGFNNNQWKNNWAYIKCGSNKYDSTATITTGWAIPEAIDRVELTIDTLKEETKVTSITLELASDAAFTEIAQSVNVTPAAGVLTFAIETPAPNMYYRLSFVCAKTSSNGIVQISKVEYIKD